MIFHGVLRQWLISINFTINRELVLRTKLASRVRGVHYNLHSGVGWLVVSFGCGMCVGRISVHVNLFGFGIDQLGLAGVL